MRKKIIQVSDYCPETEDLQRINVTFAEIWAIGMQNPGYKALSYSCDYAENFGCNSNGSNGFNCPLFKKAIQEMA